jgi:hypothetical protein
VRQRIRTIKPEAFSDEDLWDAEQETGLPLFRAFVGLWTVADREGRFEWRPRPLKAAILPYWEGDMARVLDACCTRGFVVRYECDGRTYGCIPTFTRHQSINNREEPSTLPPPPGSAEESDEKSGTSTRERRVNDASTTRPAREEHAGQGEGKGREGNGRERRVGDARSLASRAAGLSERRGPLIDGQPFNDWLRAGVTRGYESLRKPAPRETRDPLWVGWRELEAWVVDKARLLGRDEPETGRHLIRCFLRSPIAAKKGFPITFLVQNGNEFWRDELPPEVAA